MHDSALGTPLYIVRRRHTPTVPTLAIFPTGHMVYINEDALRGMHDYAASFIRETQSGR